MTDGRRQRALDLLRKGRGLAKTPEAALGLRFGVLSTFNLSPFALILTARLFEEGLPAKVYVGPFGQVEQELLDPSSGLLSSRPQHLLIVVAVEDLLGTLLTGEASSEQREGLVSAQVERLESMLRTAGTAFPQATLYFHLVPPLGPVGGYVADREAAVNPYRLLQGFERAVDDMLGHFPHIVLVEWTELEHSTPRTEMFDPRLWYNGRMRLSYAGQAALAGSIVGGYRRATGGVFKVVVVDLDNTLWGGVVGEAGIAGIALGEEGVGLAFRDFQQELLKLTRAGVLLAVVSKNNMEDAMEAIKSHPAMVLRPEDFVAILANWDDKAANLQRLAVELNLGLDSFLFLDDNPVERSWVRAALPAVTVPELPEDPAERPRFLASLPGLCRLSLTEADRERAESYRAMTRRQDLLARAQNVEDFLTSLEQVVQVFTVDATTAPRASQLSQRTNQFNLTTRRYTLSETQALITDADVDVLGVNVRDRFGDSGFAGLAIVRYAERVGSIDTFLLSCRVLGRGVEDVLLKAVRERAHNRGMTMLEGRYVPTQKNRQVEQFYQARGFRADGNALRLDLECASLQERNR